MRFKWVLFIALRYIFHKQKKSAGAVLSILGIATGVFALIVIISVMNGFQLGFIESILGISSYHLRIASLPPEKIAEARQELLSAPGIVAAVPFIDFQGLIRGSRGGQQAAFVRAVPAQAIDMDSSFAERLEFTSGFFDLTGENKALVGSELARRLNLRYGEEFTLFSIPSLFTVSDSNENPDESSETSVFTVAGIFTSDYFEFDTSWVFINIESAGNFSEDDPILGLKIRNRFHERQALELSRSILAGRQGFEAAVFSSWRDYNRTFFGALRTEKLFMFILVGLIFIVVGLNIYQAQRRAVLEHREEIGLMRAVGGGEWPVRLVFVCDGAIIGFSGGVVGLSLGLLIASNISRFFTAIEIIVNFFIDTINIVMGLFGSNDVSGFSIFSPAVFYLKEIPSRVIPGEAALIFLFGFLSALCAAWFASRKVARIRPAEVLRYE